MVEFLYICMFDIELQTKLNCLIWPKSRGGPLGAGMNVSGLYLDPTGLSRTAVEQSGPRVEAQMFYTVAKQEELKASIQNMECFVMRSNGELEKLKNMVTSQSETHSRPLAFIYCHY